MTSTDEPHVKQDGPLAGARELANAINMVEAEVLRQQDNLNRTKKLERLLQELARARDAGWLLHIKAACDREKEFLKSLREEGHAAIPVIERLFLGAKEESARAIDDLPSVLEKLTKQQQLSLDYARSRHPNYYFGDDGLIEVRISDQRAMARVATREGKLTDIPVDAAAIVERVKQEVSRLFEREFKGDVFLSHLRDAYLSAAKAHGAKDGEPVPIRAVFTSMSTGSKGKKPYKADEFLVDLSRLLAQGPGEISGRHFELQQTKDTNEGMLLLGAAGRGMVNLLIFK